MKMGWLLWVVGIMIPSCFGGLMIATAGGAIHPPLVRAGESISCPGGTLEIQSRNYSYGATRGTSHNIFCVGPDGERKEVTLLAIFSAFLVYSGVLAVLVLPFAILARRKLKKLISSRKGASLDAQLKTALQGQPLAPGGQAAKSAVWVTSSKGADLNQVLETFQAFPRVHELLSSAVAKSSPSGNVQQRLEMLQQLHGAGLITQQEYDEKKAEILSRI